jgi:hypothetical protein
MPRVSAWRVFRRAQTWYCYWSVGLSLSTSQEIYPDVIPAERILVHDGRSGYLDDVRRWFSHYTLLELNKYPGQLII